MVQETCLTVNDLIYPVFVMEGSNCREAIVSMPDCYRYSLDLLIAEVAEAYALGIGAIALFPLIPAAQKDNAGTESYNPEGLVPRAIRAIKQGLPDLVVITDVALDPYSTEGHDGIVQDGQILNDETVAAYNVSGEYAMIKAAAQQGWIDEQKIVLETLTGLKRAGADLILTYFAKAVARWLS